MQHRKKFLSNKKTREIFFSYHITGNTVFLNFTINIPFNRKVQGVAKTTRLFDFQKLLSMVKKRSKFTNK